MNNWEIAAIAAISGCVSSLVSVAVFWASRITARSTIVERITRCEEGSESAMRGVADIDNELKDMAKKHSENTSALHIKIDAANGAWQLRWENVIREFASNENIRDMERRLMAASSETEKRLTGSISELVKRVDVVIGQGRGGK